MLRKILMTGALALALPLAHGQADPACSGACASLVGEGMALAVVGKLPDALAKYKAAAEVAPKASAPVAAIADMYLRASASPSLKPEQAEVLRKQSAAFARAALALAPADPLALEVLRTLADATPPPLRPAHAAAAAVMQEAEVLFARRQYPAALEKYEQAMRLDPQFSSAWVGAGDCWYAQGNWARAEPLFRRATEIEARNGQAWRFLSDALGQQGKLADADRALLSGIAADPSQMPSWNKLTSLRKLIGKPLTPLGLQRGADIGIGADGKATVRIDESLQKSSPPFDTAMRVALAVGEASARTGGAVPKPSPFGVEMAAWTLAMQAADEMAAKDNTQPTDPGLLAMQRISRDGQLEPAIFVLLYKEVYRPDYERWLAAHPDGVKAFIERYGLRP
jgi:tetratricopeptide (TPR) repeat protein